MDNKHSILTFHTHVHLMNWIMNNNEKCQKCFSTTASGASYSNNTLEYRMYGKQRVLVALPFPKVNIFPRWLIGSLLKKKKRSSDNCFSIQMFYSQCWRHIAHHWIQIQHNNATMIKMTIIKTLLMQQLWGKNICSIPLFQRKEDSSFYHANL